MTGKCHICKEQTLIRFCKLCDHWFCNDCRKKYWSRGLAAVREMIGGKHPGCCGVTDGIQPSPSS